MEGLLTFVARLHGPTQRDFDAAEATREQASMEVAIALQERDYDTAAVWHRDEVRAERELMRLEALRV